MCVGVLALSQTIRLRFGGGRQTRIDVTKLWIRPPHINFTEFPSIQLSFLSGLIPFRIIGLN